MSGQQSRDQLGNPHGQIRVIAIRLQNHCILLNVSTASKCLIRMRGHVRWSKHLLFAYVIIILYSPAAYLLTILMSCNVRKRTFGQERPAMIQISLRIRTVWSDSSLGAFWVAMFLMRTKRTMIRLCECAGWSEFSLGAHIRRYVSRLWPMCKSLNNMPRLYFKSLLWVSIRRSR